ncbi:MAG: hypothetical protein JRF59_05285 [Deltaproteobacteria bacterium]|nr:hypothetical protein [Deltaproteobacteria bacterium]
MTKKDMHRPTDPSEGVHDFLDLLGRYPDDPIRTDIALDDLAALLYTGGTTEPEHQRAAAHGLGLRCRGRQG